MLVTEKKNNERLKYSFKSEINLPHFLHLHCPMWAHLTGLKPMQGPSKLKEKLLEVVRTNFFLPPPTMKEKKKELSVKTEID